MKIKNRNLGIQSFQPVNAVARYPFPFPHSPHLKRVTFEKCSSLERRPSVVKPDFCVHLITKTEGLPASSLWLPLCRAMSRSGERDGPPESCSKSPAYQGCRIEVWDCDSTAASEVSQTAWQIQTVSQEALYLQPDADRH